MDNYYFSLTFTIFSKYQLHNSVVCGEDSQEHTMLIVSILCLCWMTYAKVHVKHFDESDRADPKIRLLLSTAGYLLGTQRMGIPAGQIRPKTQITLRKEEN